jgi:A/G-specific adenine glycosylase
MLQQTQVATVIPYWTRWMKRLPTIDSLARAREATVIKLWEGLGYYSRARNLRQAAKQIQSAHQGGIPNNRQQLLALPGIGRYTAGAILSIAHDQPEPILDGNVIRVLARLFRLVGDPTTKPLNDALWQVSLDLVLRADRLERRSFRHPCSLFNQSLMELGALICTPRNPNCPDCPLSTRCLGLQHQEIQRLPSPREKRKYLVRHVAALILQRQGKVLVRRRPDHGVNARLWEFPSFTASNIRQVEVTAKKRLGAKLVDSAPLLTVKHAITNKRITTSAYAAVPLRRSPVPKLPGETQFCTTDQLQRLAFPSAHRQIADYLTATEKKQRQKRGRT